MAHAPETADVRVLERSRDQAHALAPAREEAKALRAWERDLAAKPRPAEKRDERPTGKPMGIVCEPVN
ncbi:MAG: hypothetical protein JNK58_03925 [Phycisphaerae bacterium]|nr:hypothetical protein [Phycisphaerae bacterium]